MEDERDLKKTVKKSGEKGLFKKKGTWGAQRKKYPSENKEEKRGSKRKKKKGCEKTTLFLEGKKNQKRGLPSFSSLLLNKPSRWPVAIPQKKNLYLA